MFRPQPDTFLASTALEDDPDAQAERRLDQAFSVLAVTVAALAALLTANRLYGASWPSVLCIGSGVLGIGALLGRWVILSKVTLLRNISGTIYDQALLDLGSSGRQAFPAPSSTAPLRHVAQAFAEMARVTRKQSARGERLKAWHDQAHTAVCASRVEGAQLAAQIAEDAEALSVISDRIATSDQVLGQEVASVTASCNLTHEALFRAADRASALAASVRETTQRARHMSEGCVQLSHAAFKTHEAVALLADGTPLINGSINEIAAALERADRLAATATDLATPTEGGSAAAPILDEVRALAASCASTLRNTLLVVEDLSKRAMETDRRTAELGSSVALIHDLGQAVGYAVQQQSADITEILQSVYETRAGFASVRAGVAEVECARNARPPVGKAVERLARDLPNRASNVAALLRGIPDFAPQETYNDER